MPSPPVLSFLKLTGYQSQTIPGSRWLYTVDPTRPIGYTQPSKLLAPTQPSNGGIWRAVKLDSSVPVDQVVAIDIGIYFQLSDAQQACQDDANMTGLKWTLVWLLSLSYQSRPIRSYSWVYNVSQPSPDSTGTSFWRANKRDGTFDPAFQVTTPLGNFALVSDAITACQNDLSFYFPPVTNPPPVPAAPVVGFPT